MPGLQHRKACRHMRDHPKVVIRALDADGVPVEESELSYHEWYDGDVPLIDDPDECKRLGVRVIEGCQTDRGGRVFRQWRNTYDADGRIEDSEAWDDYEPGKYRL
jgi:hypothetical protein